jgi:hypothetical protein
MFRLCLFSSRCLETVWKSPAAYKVTLSWPVFRGSFNEPGIRIAQSHETGSKYHIPVMLPANLLLLLEPEHEKEQTPTHCVGGVAPVLKEVPSKGLKSDMLCRSPSNSFAGRAVLGWICHAHMAC